MHWGEVLAIIGSNIALISWLRSDMKHLESRLETKFDGLKDEVQKESRDFHGRLCAIEERNKKTRTHDNEHDSK